jgi:hypothetical protein
MASPCAHADETRAVAKAVVQIRDEVRFFKVFTKGLQQMNEATSWRKFSAVPRDGQKLKASKGDGEGLGARV